MPDAFYTSLTPVSDFEELASPDAYRPLPQGWSIVAADIAKSTQAIAEGRYKAVNTVGVAVIAAVRNATRPVEVPYVFGGDGAVLCVPDRFAGAVRSALAATIAMAESSFDLTLRAAVVPVTHIRDQGLDVLVARHQVSTHYVQCAMFGGGGEYVEQALKDGALPRDFVVTPDAGASVDYHGLECRWEEVPSPAEETVAVIVSSTATGRDSFKSYRWIMDRVAQIYGDASSCRPVTEEGLTVDLIGSSIHHETALQRWRDTPGRRALATLLMRLYVALGWLRIALGIRTTTTGWATYRQDLVRNTDFRKFDGTVRFVLAGTVGQRRALTEFLDRLVEAGVARYGIHVSHAALITCLVDQRQGEHFHFVDAVGGGYAAAAVALKNGQTT